MTSYVFNACIYTQSAIQGSIQYTYWLFPLKLLFSISVSSNAPPCCCLDGPKVCRAFGLSKYPSRSLYYNLGTKEQRGPLITTSQSALLESSNNRHVLKRHLAVDNDGGSLLQPSSWIYTRYMGIYMDIELTLTVCYKDGFKDKQPWDFRQILIQRRGD